MSASSTGARCGETQIGDAVTASYHIFHPFVWKNLQGDVAAVNAL